jgi:hypothetical protein
MQQTTPRYPITVEEAIQRGHVTVNYPVMGVFLLPLPLFWFAPNASDVIWLVVAVITFVAAWSWWSWRLPKWRVWALENVDDLDGLISRAVSEKLMWPPGHFFEKTEIKSKALRERERTILQQRRSELLKELHGKRDAF